METIIAGGWFCWLHAGLAHENPGFRFPEAAMS